jgi:putative ABC transport system permease protein
MRSYFGELAERIQALPGVRAVTSGSDLPLAVPGWLFTPIRAEGESTPPDGYVALEHAVMPNYLQVLGIRLLAGRGFDDRDGPASPRVAIINRTAARELFGAANPIGKMIEFVSNKRRGVEGDQPVQVVGLAENVHEFGPDEVPFDVVYLPFAQHPVNAAYFLVTAKSSGAQLAASVRSAAYEIDKDQPVFDIQTMDERIVQSLMGARANMSLVGALAVVALVLVAVGTFGTIAYFVQQRTKEFGIRVALGASRAMVFQEAIAQSLRIGCAGVLMGVTASLILGRFLRSTLYMVPHEHMGMLYGVNIYDPLVLSGTCVGLLLVLLLASYWPARRASRIEPMVALRYE